ncbi:short chain dehydrogenase reductase [Nemania sp. FL0031]|nr:short chain dehydrogenase reductase [Nemania sp. FL0031]
MATLEIKQDSIPSLLDKVALITGGASGIGLAAARILSNQGAEVHIIDLDEPLDPPPTKIGMHFHRCDVTNWEQLRAVFDTIGRVDYAFANAGALDETDYFADTFDSNAKLQEPAQGVFDINFRAVVNFIKLAWSSMRRQNVQGSIVITTSATAYAPEQSVPVLGATKLALVGIIRALRSVVIKDGITINGVAPAATQTKLLPEHLAAPIIAMGLPVSTASFVGLALVYSATAQQKRRVEVYGKEHEDELWTEERWNGRVILTLGERYTEIEGPLADLKPFWFGQENVEWTRLQQAATDFRV